MPSNYGNNLYGYGFYGDEDPNRAINRGAEVWHETNPGIPIHPKTTTYGLLKRLLADVDRMEEDLSDIRDAQHLPTAVGSEIDKLAQTVGIRRKSGESDEKYVARVKANVAASITGTTISDTINFAASVLDTSTENIELGKDYVNDDGTITIRIDAGILDDSDLTESELVTIFDGLVPAAHTIVIVERGTFTLKSDGETDDASAGLTSDSISTGGTLSGRV